MIEKIQESLGLVLAPFEPQGFTVCSQGPSVITAHGCPLLVYRIHNVTPQEDVVCQANHRVQQLYQYQGEVKLYLSHRNATQLQSTLQQHTDILQRHLKTLLGTEFIQNVVIQSVEFEGHEGEPAVMSSTTACAFYVWQSEA